jgi:hypothetical protein
METRKASTPAKNQASSAGFYLRSPFHNSTFFAVTILLVLDLLICAFTLVACLRRSNLRAALCTGFAVVLLVVLWRLGLWAHKEIQILFETEQIRDLEKGSALDKVIGVATRMIIGGLFGAFFLAGFCLAAFGEVLLSR